MKSVSRKLALAVLVTLGAAACGDKVTVPPATTTTPRVHSVTVSPSSATVAQGSSFTFGASVDADASLARTVTWSAAGGTGITVDANGVASASATATGIASICATSTADTGVKGCASLTVAGAAAASTVQIDAITVGCTPLNAALPGAAGCGLLVPVQTNNVGGQIDVAVIVNRPPNSGVTGVKVDVLGGATFSTVEATYSQTLTGDFIAQSDLAAQATTQTNRIVFSVQTAAYTVGTGNVVTVRHINGQKKLRASLIGGTQTGQAETQLSFRNANGWHVQVTTNIATGSNANATCGANGATACNVRTNSTTTGLAWNGGTPLAITASAINFTNFPAFGSPGVGTGVAFGSACDLSGLGLRASSTALTTIASNTPANGTGPVISGTLPYTNGAIAAVGTLNAYAIAPAGLCGAAGEIPAAVGVDANGNNFINFGLGGAFAGNVYNNVITPVDPTLATAPAIRLDNAGPAPISGYATGRNLVGADRCYGLFLNVAQLDGNGLACPANIAANTVGGLGAISINSSTAAAFVGGRTARLNGWVNDAVNFGALASTGATQAVVTTAGDINGAISPSATATGLPADVGIGNTISFTARIGACSTVATCATLASRTSTTGITQETNASNPTAGVANPGYGAIIQTVDVFGNVTNPPAIGPNFLLVSNPLDPANPYVVAGVLYLGLDRTLPTVTATGAAGTTATANTIQILSAANFTYTSDDPVPTGNFASSGVLTAAPGGDLYVSMGRRDGATLQYFCATAVNYQPASNTCTGVTGWATGVTAQPATATAASATVYNRAAGVVLTDPGAGTVRAYYAVTAFSRDQAGNQTSAAVQTAQARDFIFDNTPPSSFGGTFSPGVLPANAAVTFTGNATEDLDVGRGAFSIRFPVLNFASNATGGDFIRLPWANKNVTGQLANPIGYLAPGPSALALSLSSTWSSAIRSIEVVDAGGAAAYLAAGFAGGAAAGAVNFPGTITAMNGGTGYVQDGNLANGAGPTQYNFFSQSVSRVGLAIPSPLAAPATVPPGGGTALSYGQTGMSTGTMPCTAAVANTAGAAAFWTATQAVGAACVLTGTNNGFFNMGWAIVNPIQAAPASVDLNGAGVAGANGTSKNYTAVALGVNGVLQAPFVVVKFYAVDTRQPLNIDASGGIAAAPAPAAALLGNGAGTALVELCTVSGTGSSTPGQPGIFNDQVTNTWQYTCNFNPSTGGAASVLQQYDFAGFNLANSTNQHTAAVNAGFWGSGQVLGAGFNQGWQGGAPAGIATSNLSVIAVGCNQNGNCLATRVSNNAGFSVTP